MEEGLKKAIAEELNVEPSTLSGERLLNEIETWDSVMALTIMVLLNDHLPKPVEPGEIAKLKTFGDIESLVTAKQG